MNRLRPVVSLTTLFSFALASLSGVALYLRPEGSLSRWLAWNWLGLDKKAWELLHTGTVMLLLLSAGVHTVLNFNSLVSYLRRKSQSLLPNSLSLLMATLLTLLFALGPALQIPPFHLISQLRADFKSASLSELPMPPEPETENLSLSELSSRLSLPLQNLVKRLEENGYTITGPEMTLFAIAQANQTSPARLYQLLIP